MDERLRLRIKQFNEIKYGNDNELRIVFGTLKPQGTVTTATKKKEEQANVKQQKYKIIR